MNQLNITSYQQADKIWATCKNPIKGKPFTAGIRMFKEKDDYILKFNGHDAVTVRPDNTIEIKRHPHVGNGFALMLENTFGFIYYRVSKDNYRIRGSNKTIWIEKSYDDDEWAHNKDGSWCKTGRKITRTYRIHDHKHHHKNDPQFFDGIRFDLATHDCLNMLPPVKRVQVADANRVWRKSLTDFKRLWNMRYKLGGLVCDLSLLADQAEQGIYLNQHDIAKKMHEAVTTGRVDDYITSLIFFDDADWWSQRNAERMKEYIATKGAQSFERTYNKHRDAIRKLAGCYEMVRESTNANNEQEALPVAA